MNLSKFLLIVALITAMAHGYVHQQVELLRINYTINRNRDNLSILLDQNSTLIYNVVGLQSPFYLEQSLSAKEVSLEIPSRWHTIAFAQADETVE